MVADQDLPNRILVAIAVAAASLIHVSIAASQLTLGIGIVLLLILHRKLEFPRIWIPLIFFFAWTLLADFLSPDPWGGRPQVRKFFVFFFIPLMYGVFSKQFAKIYYVMAGWTVAAVASGIWGLCQFVDLYDLERFSAHGFYIAYLERRITGFESHWMTYGALQLSVLSLLIAQWFFSTRRMPTWIYACCIPIFCATILLGWTRSIWLGTAAALVYLFSVWRPKMLVALPVAALMAFLMAPPTTRERLNSFLHPRGEIDSNQHRLVTYETGLRMIEAHPWFGLGPEQIGKQFAKFEPADVRSRPLPPGYYGHLHDIYLQYSAERGVPGMLLLMWLIAMTMWDCFRAIRRSAGQRSQQLFLLHGAVAVTIGILVGGIFEYNLGDSEVLMMFVSVIGLAYAAIRTLSKEVPTAQPQKQQKSPSPDNFRRPLPAGRQTR